MMRWPFGIYSREMVNHLKGEVEVWKLMYRRERQRAEDTLDRLLAEKGIPPIAGPVRRDTVDGPTPDELVAEALQTEDFVGVGKDV